MVSNIKFPNNQPNDVCQSRYYEAFVHLDAAFIKLMGQAKWSEVF